MNVVQVTNKIDDFIKIIALLSYLAVQIPPPAPKVKKAKEIVPKLPDKTKWTMEEQKQFFSALRIVLTIFHSKYLYLCFSYASMEKTLKHLDSVLIVDVVLLIRKHRNVHLVKYVVFIIVHFVPFPNYAHLRKVNFYVILILICFILIEEKSNVDSLELRSVLAYLCLKPKVKCEF